MGFTSFLSPALVMAAIRKESNVFQCMHESKVAAIHLVA